MKWTALFLLALPALAADVSGAWSGTLSGPVYLILKQEGAQLRGTAGATSDDQFLKFDGGTVQDDHIQFKMGPYRLDLHLEGGRLVGEAHDGSGSRKVYFKRPVVRKPGDPLPTFDVASVKPAPPPGPSLNSSMSLTPGRLTCVNVTIRKLMARAYNLRDYQIHGPDWTGTELYNIEASLPPDTSTDDLLAMVQQLLADRFGLRYHKESREFPVYVLSAGKTGSKLKEVEFGRGSTSLGPGKLEAHAIPLRNFTDTLSRMLDRPVLDQTGLTGVFDFTLEWTPEPRSGESAPAEAPAGPSLFTAIQEQLGLKLESRKSPLDVFVIDHAERIPTGN